MLPALLRPGLGYSSNQLHTTLCINAAIARSMSSGPAVVDQMLSYVWGDLKGQGQPSVDVLRSGLSMQPDPSKGFDSARLHLALAEVFAAEHDWAQAASSGQAAAAAAATAAASPASAGLAGLAGFHTTRALLVSGRDHEAAAFTSSSSNSSSSSSSSGGGGDDVSQLAQQLLVQHATGADIGLLHQKLLGKLHQHDSSSGGSSSGDRLQAVLLALNHKVAGDAALAQGTYEEASSSYDAAHAALGVVSNSSSGAGSGSSSSLQADPSAGVSARFQHEIAADIALGAAQVHMFQRQWEASEDKLSSALKSAEAAAGESHPMLAPVLLLLATGYARQARVMYAEGMLRECGKLIGGTEPHRLVDRSSSSISSSSSSHQAAHPSLKAAFCWRYCQLLTALPNRSAQAAAWEAAAKQLWAKAGGIADVSSSSESNRSGGVITDIEAVLGDDVALKGQGQHGHGRGAVVSLFLRRLLPVYHSSSSS